MRPKMIGLIDAGFVNRSGASLLQDRGIRLEGSELTGWLRASALRLDVSFLRAYYYDGAVPPTDQARYQEQQKRFKELDACPGLQLRLGHLESRPFDFKPAIKNALAEVNIKYSDFAPHFKPEKVYQQKGVDTLIVLDMVRLVQQQACEVIILMAGDRDLAEAVRTVQQMGATVHLAYPKNAPVADELRDLADGRTIWSERLVRRMATKLVDRFEQILANEYAEYGEQADGTANPARTMFQPRLGGSDTGQ